MHFRWKNKWADHPTPLYEGSYEKKLLVFPTYIVNSRYVQQIITSGTAPLSSGFHDTAMDKSAV
jgi:hypothetical protein